MRYERLANDDDLDKPLTWEQIISLMFRWHVSSVSIEFLADRDGIKVHFLEGSQWQTWYFQAKDL